jgi:outer membrane protein TolC
MIMKRIAISALILAMATAPVWCAESLDVAALEGLAATGNLDLIKARSAVEAARAALAGTCVLAGARLSVSGSYDYAGSSAPQGPQAAPGAQAQITLPLATALSLTGSVSTQGSGSLSVKLTPFAAGTTTASEEKAYRTALLQASYQARKLGYDVQVAAYALLSAGQWLEIAVAKLALKEDSSGVAQKSYDLGDLSYGELLTARTDLLSARQGLFDAERGVLSARISLLRLLGPGSGEPQVKAATGEELAAEIAKRDVEIEAQTGSAPESLALRVMGYELEALRAKLAATPVYRPDLAVSAHLDYPLAAGASVSLSFSPSDIRSDERAAVAESVVAKEREIELERMAAMLQGKILDQALRVARQVLSARQTEVSQATSALAESRLLLEQGRVTSLETRQSELDLQSSQARLFQAETDILSAQAAILMASSR